MGGRAKVAERAAARRMRSGGATVPDIAAALGVSRSSVSLWVRDVVPEVPVRRRPVPRGPNRLQREKEAEIARLRAEAVDVVGQLSERELLVAGLALYAGEGSKTRDGLVSLANTDPRIITLWCAWVRRFLRPDESRLRARLYLHEDLDLDTAVAFWSELTGIPAAQFTQPYRALADPSRRLRRHEYGCLHVRFTCARSYRYLMGLVDAVLLSSAGSIRGSSTGRASDC